MSTLADAVLPLVRTRAQFWRWEVANAHGQQMHDAVDVLEAAIPTADAAEVYAVTHKSLASAIKVIARADDSSGIIGDACRRLIALHPTVAAAAGVAPSRLVDWMISSSLVATSTSSHLTLWRTLPRSARRESGITAPALRRSRPVWAGDPRRKIGGPAPTTGDLLFVGEEAERRYGRVHYRDLVAVFTAPPQFVVLHGRSEIGQIDPLMLTRKVDGPRVILLGGRPWHVTYTDWKRKRACVEPAETAGEIRWISSPVIESYAVSDAVRRVPLGPDPDHGVRLTKRDRRSRRSAVGIRPPGFRRAFTHSPGSGPIRMASRRPIANARRSCRLRTPRRRPLEGRRCQVK